MFSFIRSSLNYWLENNKYKAYPALGNSVVLIQFDKPKKTGKLFGIDVYNYIFVRVKGDWFTPVIYPAVKNLGVNKDDFFKPYTRGEKMRKYYHNELYENISGVMVYGDNHTTNLMMLLALWTPFELVKRVYKLNGDLFEKYHWVLSRYSLMKYGSTVKLGLFDFVNFSKMVLYGGVVPLFYNDSVFVADTHNMIGDLSVYNNSSGLSVLKNIISIYSDPGFNYNLLIGGKQFNLPWTLVTSMYPFIIWRIPSDYGYIVNYSLVDYVKNYGEVKFARVEAPKEKWYKQNIKVSIGWDSVFISGKYDVTVDGDYLYFWMFDTSLTKISLDDVQTAYIGYRKFSEYSEIYGINVKDKNGDLKNYEFSTRMFNGYGDKPVIILKK